jgi:hypothetical protein
VVIFKALVLQRKGRLAQPLKRQGKVFLPQRGAGIADRGIVPPRFELIEPADQPQHALRGLRSFGGRFNKRLLAWAKHPTHSAPACERT